MSRGFAWQSSSALASLHHEAPAVDGWQCLYTVFFVYMIAMHNMVLSAQTLLSLSRRHLTCGAATPYSLASIDYGRCHALHVVCALLEVAVSAGVLVVQCVDVLLPGTGILLAAVYR